MQNEEIILDQLREMREEMKDLREQISKMKFQDVNDANTTLVNHIEFINRVYANMQRPLNYLMNKVNNIFLLNNE